MIGKHNFVEIENVQDVEGLNHNLLSISQLCDNDLEVLLEVIFNSNFSWKVDYRYLELKSRLL